MLKKNFSEKKSGKPGNVLYILPVFISGFAGLTYEVLWLRQLGSLFGNTAYASAATLGAFFMGIAAGSFYWGKKSKHLSNPLVWYAFLEIGIAITSSLFFLLIRFYYAIYSPVFETIGHSQIIFTSIKFLFSVTILFLPCFFMGGTFPIISEALISHRDILGKSASFLYAINTLGAASGAIFTSFYSILHFGVIQTYSFAIGLNLLAGLLVFILHLNKRDGGSEKQSNVIPLKPKYKTSEKPLMIQRWVFILALVSGFLTICLEVLWIRMFALVLQNSVYSFSVVFITFIISLALGSLLANRLNLLPQQPPIILIYLLVISGVCTGLSPTLFFSLTNGLDYLGEFVPWNTYLWMIVQYAGLIILLPGICVGSIFPYLMRLSQDSFTDNTGSILGRITGLNTIGSAFGAFIAGFVLLELWGLWGGLFFIAILYCTIALIFSLWFYPHTFSIHIWSIIGVGLLVMFFNPTKLTLVQLDKEKEKLEELWEGGYGSVSVVRGGENLSLVVDNYYILGDLTAPMYERMQSHLPLILHPKPDTIFYIGMGTGITAGASMLHPVSSVTICELIPEVVWAAKKYFSPYVHGLFNSKKTNIIQEDGRNFLLGSQSTYDVIISDLYIPWQAGTGSLYSLEHYETIFSRLQSGGLFVQWLPLYQVSEQEFFIIARTMLEVFPQVTLWRSDFFSANLIVALIGYRDTSKLEPEAIIRGMKNLSTYKSNSDEYIKTLSMLFYAGNISENRTLFQGSGINTDNLPLIEYLTPVTQRMIQAKDNKRSWFESNEFLKFYEKLQKNTPPEYDPYLSLLDEEYYRAVKAGFQYYKGVILEDNQKLREAGEWQKKFFSNFEPELANELQKKGFLYIGE